MSIEKIVTLTVFLSFICIIGTSAHLNCHRINDVNTTQLSGFWHYIGEVSTSISLTKCGYFIVNETSSNLDANGVSSNTIFGTWTVVKHTGAKLEHSIRVSGRPNRRSVQVSGYGQFRATVGVCVEKTLIFIKREKTGEIYVFSRNITVSSDISDPFVPEGDGLMFNEYADINCRRLE